MAKQKKRNASHKQIVLKRMEIAKNSKDCGPDSVTSEGEGDGNSKPLAITAAENDALANAQAQCHGACTGKSCNYLETASNLESITKTENGYHAKVKTTGKCQCE